MSQIVCWIGLVTSILVCIGGTAYAAECAPKEAIEAYESGQAHLESGRLDKGISEIERAVSIYPDFGDAWYDLYDSYKRAGRPDDEIRALRQLIRINPGVYSGANIWRQLLALHLAEARIPSAAAEALNECRRFKPGSKRAVASCERALGLHADYVDAHYFLGVNYIYAGDEAAAKEQVAALTALDPTMAGMLAHVMDELTDWMTEEYKKELQSLFAASDVQPMLEASVEALPAQFSDQDVARILGAYDKQIEALQDLMADPKSRPEACRREAPAEVSNELKGELMPLSFVRIERSHNPDCQHGMGYLLLDTRERAHRRRGVSEVVKIAAIPGLGDTQGERWRVGLRQEWVKENYCKAECSAMLQFRIDRETDGQVVRFNAWVAVLEDVVDIARCGSHHGEMPGAEEW